MPEQPAKKPFAAFAQEGIMAPDNPGQYMVFYAYENEPGYAGTTYTGTLEYCKAVADSINESLGVSRDRALDILASSHAAGPVQGS